MKLSQTVYKVLYNVTKQMENCFIPTSFCMYDLLGIKEMALPNGITVKHSSNHWEIASSNLKGSTANHGWKVQESKIGIEGMALYSLLSITVTLTNYGHL